MKNLLLMRHAKSSHANSQLSDFERPLNPRGERTAPQMADLLLHHRVVPDLVVSSTARRAQQTAELMIEMFPSSTKWQETRTLYLAPPQSYLEVLFDIEDNHESVMLIGHNPGIEQLVYNFSACLEPMPTAAVAWLSFDVHDWSEIQLMDRDSLREIWRPKEVLP